MRILAYGLAWLLFGLPVYAQGIPFPGPGTAHSTGGASTLARTFNGTSDNLQSAATVDLSSTKIISLSVWIYWDSFANDDDLAMEFSANYNSNTGSFILDPNDGGGTFAANIQTVGGGTGTAMLCTFTRPSGAAWHHYLFVWDLTLVAGTCNVYVDGTSASPTVTNGPNEVATFFGNFTLNVMSRNAASLFGDGRISDITIWKSALSSGNATTLAACGNPESIDFANILNRWKIVQASPETPSVGAVNLTVTGTTNSASSCP